MGGASRSSPAAKACKVGSSEGSFLWGGGGGFVLFWLASYSQKAILKISIAKIHQNLREKIPYFSTHGSGSQL
jgi:galactokinase/mevalonate kinase-like predicted kinase